MFGSVTHCRRMFEESTDGELREHFLLDAAEDFGEVDMAGVGSAGHGTRVYGRKRPMPARRSAKPNV